MRKIPVQNYMEGAQIHHTRVDQKVMIRQPSPDKEDFKKKCSYHEILNMAEPRILVMKKLKRQTKKHITSARWVQQFDPLLLRLLRGVHLEMPYSVRAPSYGNTDFCE